MSFLMNRSPIVSSTPGGTESGVRPSLDCRFVVAEKFRRDEAGVVWKAGTRKLGNVTVEEEEAATALSRARLPVLGASIVGVGGGGTAIRDALLLMDLAAIAIDCSRKRSGAGKASANSAGLNWMLSQRSGDAAPVWLLNPWLQHHKITSSTFTVPQCLGTKGFLATQTDVILAKSCS